MNKEKQIEEMAEYMIEIQRSFNEYCAKPCRECELGGDVNCENHYKAEALYNAGFRKIPDNIGDFSDGYHSFNELYHHRAVLFSVICNTYPEKAWKSKLHDTGDMYEGMFIVGIETEQGQATYHYDIEPYWDMFKVKELDKAPKWDGHTPSDAIERIGSLSCEGYRKQSEWISVDERLPDQYEDVLGFCHYVYESGGVFDLILTMKLTTDGKFVPFNCSPLKEGIVTHWMPLPEPPDMKGGE